VKAQRRNDVRQDIREPRVELLLREAFEALAEMRRLRRIVLAGGVDSVAVPGDVELRSFALLGNYGREAQVRELMPHMPLLVGKGFLRDGDVTGLSTPVLRFLVAVTPLLHGVLGISQRMQEGVSEILRDGAVQGLGPVIRCAGSASGHWGQTLIVNAQVTGAAWVLVRPDEVFSQRENLLRVAASEVLSFEVSCDEGMVLVAAMDDMGTVSVHQMTINPYTDDDQ